MKPPRAEDDQVCLDSAIEQDADRVPRFPRVHPLGPGAAAVDHFPAHCSYHPDDAAESVRQLVAGLRRRHGIRDRRTVRLAPEPLAIQLTLDM